MLRLDADRLIDGAADGALAPAVLRIDGERIIAVDAGEVPSRPPAVDGLRVSLPGCTLLPGLIDFHTHAGIDTRSGGLAEQAHEPPALTAGNALRRLQAEIGAGRVVGPRLVVAGRAIKSPRGGGGVIASIMTDDIADIACAA